VIFIFIYFLKYIEYRGEKEIETDKENINIIEEFEELTKEINILN
jgi:hypothetical protein